MKNFTVLMKRMMLLFLVSVSLQACRATENIKVYDLRCENLTNPMGIATRDARLSWKIQSAVQGDRQTAYHILVASSEDLLTEGKANVWDSGEIESSESVLVSCPNMKLLSSAIVYWKVRIRNKNGQYTAWSPAARFSVGLLTPSDWQATYIGFPDEAGDPQSPLLRKRFELKNKPKNALLHINSLGYHEIHINGKKVSNDEPLAPAVSQFNKRSLSKTYDVSSFLKKGANDLVIHLSRGWYQPGLPGVVHNGPVVKAQLETYENNALNILLTTDASWQTCESGYSLTADWRPWRFGGERIDANLSPSDFDAPTLDKRQWRMATAIHVPEHTVAPQMTEANRITERYHAASITTVADSTHLVDIGKALTGWTEIKFPPLRKGQEITISYCDHLDSSGQFINQRQTDYYIASGKPKEIFRNKFNYHSYRYIQIAGLDKAPQNNDITALLIRTDYDDAATFACSDRDMNAIHDMIRYTLHNLSLSGYLVDCHHIERLGYGGDGHASTLTAQTLFNLPSLYANWLQAWSDCIRPDGGLPHTAPNPYSAGGGPFWCAFIVTAPWSTYQNYGDRRFIETYYPVMQHWFQYVDYYTADGLLKKWPDTDYRSWYLGDWLPPRGVDQRLQASIDLVNNCAISECYALMEKMAIVLGKTDDASLYAGKRESLNRLLHETYFHPDVAGYASLSQIDIAYPMLTGVTPSDYTEAVKEKLFYETEHTLNGHIGTGLVGISVITQWAIHFNQPDFMYAMLKKRDYPGYLYMIDNGATTTWEDWKNPRSYIHNCFNGIGSWFYQAVGGIRPDESTPGYRQIFIQPQIPAGIIWAKTSKETPYGTLVVNWEKNEKQILFDLAIPVGCTARLPLPEHVKTYTINNQNFNRTNAQPVILQSGKYKMSYKL